MRFHRGNFLLILFQPDSGRKKTDAAQGGIGLKAGAAGGDRTHDPRLRRPILYPLSYSRKRSGLSLICQCFRGNQRPTRDTLAPCTDTPASSPTLVSTKLVTGCSLVRLSTMPLALRCPMAAVASMPTVQPLLK